MTEDTNIVGQLSIRYADNPIIQALLQLIPGWSSADTLIQRRANEIRAERIKVFFDELAQGRQVLTEELIQTEDYLHSFFCTLRATVNTRRREKIKLYARLLDSTLDPSLSVSSDEYEELLNVLDEISHREFVALMKLSELESYHPIQENQNQLQNTQTYWDDFKNSVIENLGVPEESFKSFMAKMERTGLYFRIIGNYWDYSGDIGRTTQLFTRLTELIQQDN